MAAAQAFAAKECTKLIGVPAERLVASRGGRTTMPPLDTANTHESSRAPRPPPVYEVSVSCR